ncbi:protein PHYTOCHROME KINASE SUBSTRATE 2-like [Apium graveolens]|uniref:protein PHYTOCHROME KINASE SUBSTRATE 2-like n=1 Tax=Apium graveolens TaxID=4045 RepID=UPI003D7A6242
MAIVSSKTLSFESISNHRDASFSSYLHGDEGILALCSHELIYASPKKIEDKEIGVFSAEKYFKGDMDDDADPKSTDTSSKSYHHEKDIPVNLDLVKLKVQPRTPSVHSSSSYNSQTVLLPTNHQSRNMTKAFCKSFLSSLSCKYCSCSEKNSVVIDDHVVESKKQSKALVEQTNKTAESDQKNKTPARKWSEQEKVPYKKFDEMEFQSRREDCFNFPVLDPIKGSLAATMESPGEDNTIRKSLEVFGSPRTPITNQVNKTLSFGRKSTMFTWDLVNPQTDETGIPKNQDLTSDDYESDASSELFEIESFSTKTNSVLERQTSERDSSLTPTTCYAPSEASIEWSVVTASAAEFSIMSDSEDLRTANTKNQYKMTRFAKNAPEKELHKRLPNILSGCKSQKAVRVAGDAYKASDKAIPISQAHHRLDPTKPVAKFQAETKLTGFNSRLGNNAFNTRVVSPANGSHLLYIK